MCVMWVALSCIDHAEELPNWSQSPIFPTSPTCASFHSISLRLTLLSLFPTPTVCFGARCQLGRVRSLSNDGHCHSFLLSLDWSWEKIAARCLSAQSVILCPSFRFLCISLSDSRKNKCKKKKELGQGGMTAVPGSTKYKIEVRTRRFR